MAMIRVEQMGEGRDAHPRWSLGHVPGVLQGRLPKSLVAAMQKEVVEYLGSTRQIEEILRVQVPEDLDASRSDSFKGSRQ